MSKQVIGLCLVLLIALGYRSIIIFNSSLTFFSDDAVYASLARFWVEGKWQYVFHPTWPPLFPLLSALTYLIHPNWETTLRLISAIAGILLLIPLFFLVKHTLSTKNAFFFTLFIQFFGPVFYTSIFPQADSLATILIITSLVLTFFGIHKQKIKLLLISAFVLGLTYLTRSEGTLFFSLTLAYLTFYFLLQVFKRTLHPRTLAVIPAFIIIFLLTASPYVIATEKQLGEWTLSAKFSAQIQQGHAFLLKDGATWAQEVTSVKSPNYKSPYFRDGHLFLLENEEYFRWWFVQKLGNWQKLFLSFFPTWSLLLIFIGILSALKRNFSSSLFLILVTLVAIPVTIFSTAISDVRYLLWTIPLFFYFFWTGANFLAGSLRLPTLLVPVVLSLFLPIFARDLILHPLSYASDFTKKHERQQFVELGNWIRNNSKKTEPKIMARHEMFEFYSNGKTVYTPQIPYEKVIEYALVHKVDYLIAWSGELSGEQELVKLTNPDMEHPGLKKVYSDSTPEGPLAVYVLEQ